MHNMLPPRFVKSHVNFVVDSETKLLENQFVAEVCQCFCLTLQKRCTKLCKKLNGICCCLVFSSCKYKMYVIKSAFTVNIVVATLLKLQSLACMLNKLYVCMCVREKKMVLHVYGIHTYINTENIAWNIPNKIVHLPVNSVKSE